MCEIHFFLKRVVFPSTIWYWVSSGGYF